MRAVIGAVGQGKALKVCGNGLKGARHGSVEVRAEFQARQHFAPVGFVAKVLLESYFDESGLVAVFGYRDHAGTRRTLIEPARDLLAGAGDADFDSA